MRAHLALGVVAVALASAACALSGEKPEDEWVPPPGRESAELLGLSEWTKDRLYCDEGECARWYRLQIAEAAELRIDVHGPAGPEAPDFDVRLEDASGELLWGFAPTGHSPRKVERMVAAGDYYLLLESVGENGGVLEYEAFPTVEPAEPIFRPGRGALPVPPPEPVRGPEVWVAAEILQVEGQAGRPISVLLDAGARDLLRPGLRGEVLADGEVIATFELVDVETGRSRGRLRRTPSETIRYDARARIRVPLE